MKTEDHGAFTPTLFCERKNMPTFYYIHT